MWHDDVDLESLVEGGVNGMKRIGAAVRGSGIDLRGLYVIRLTPDDVDDNRYADWVLRLVVPPDTDRRAPVLAIIKLRRAGMLPQMSSKLRFEAISETHIETTRIARLAREMGGPPAIITRTTIDGAIIDYAAVAEIDGVEALSA